MGLLHVGGQDIDITLAVGPSNGEPKQELTTYGSVTAQFDILAGNTLSVVVAGNSPEAPYVDELASDIWMTGALHQRFRIWAVWQDFDKQGDDRVSMQAVTYDRLINRRHVVTPAGLTFTGVDQGLILWGLWQHTQAQPGGDLGVTLGTPHLTGVLRDRTYLYGENLGTIAENLSKVEDAPIWIVNGDLEFEARMPADFPITDTPLTLGATARHLQRSSGGADYANFAYGDADAETTSPVTLATADIAADPRGRWEIAKSWPTVKLQDTLAQHVAGELEEANAPLAHWNVEMEPGRWVNDARLMPGDYAVLVVPRTLAGPLGTPFDKVVVQVVSVAVNFTAQGSLDVKLVALETRIPVPT